MMGRSVELWKITGHLQFGGLLRLCGFQLGSMTEKKGINLVMNNRGLSKHKRALCTILIWYATRTIDGSRRIQMDIKSNFR